MRTGPVEGGDTCPCGKRRYLTKKGAKRIARRILRRHDGRMNAYRCGEFWHLGHLPPFVKDGSVDRHDLPRRSA